MQASLKYISRIMPLQLRFKTGYFFIKREKEPDIQAPFQFKSPYGNPLLIFF